MFVIMGERRLTYKNEDENLYKEELLQAFPVAVMESPLDARDWMLHNADDMVEKYSDSENQYRMTSDRNWCHALMVTDWSNHGTRLEIRFEVWPVI